MFCYLLLAHLIADYPLQTKWMVKAKNHLPGLTLHVAIHYVVLFLLSGNAYPFIWPYLVVLALIHFSIDFIKSRVYFRRPDLVIIPYFLDQVFHVTSLVLVAWWIEQVVDATHLLPISPVSAIYLSGYLLVSYVWFITERILVHTNQSYQAEINRQFWPRMLVRMALLTILLTAPQSSLMAVVASDFFRFPYPQSHYRTRALCCDISVVLISWLFIQASLRLVL